MNVNKELVNSAEVPVDHVLAFSGESCRSLYTATILRYLEEELGQLLAQHFDLIGPPPTTRQ
jgi:hypothetical protein